MGSTAESSRAWMEVVAHDARFEFPDLIGFADGGSDGGVWRAGPWAAEGRLHRRAFVPRANGGQRVLTVLDPAVHARYRALVGRVADSIECSLGPEVTAGRTPGAAPGRRAGTGRGLRLQAWRRAWRRHLRAVSRMGAGEGPLVRLDVRDCFGSIEAEVVREALGRCGTPPREARELLELLRRFEADGIRGLPVGPEPSAVLANLALSRADAALRSLGLPFVRWCDDVTLAIGREDPSVAVEAWASALRALSLRPAPEKLRLSERGETPRPSMAGMLIAPSSGPGADPRIPPASSVAALDPALSGGTTTDALCERAVAAAEGGDPHLARSLAGQIGVAGGRRARAALRHMRARAPYLASTTDWGLHR